VSSKRIVVTGASRGIGRAIVERLTPEHSVLATARSVEALSELSLKTGCKTYAFDLESSDYSGFRESIEQNLGGIDLLIHNAGLLINKPFIDLNHSEILRQYQVNVFSLFEMVQSFDSLLSRDAHIVALGSIGGMIGSVKFPGLSAYSSSKGALAVLVECLQEEYKERNWAFNCLALGAVQTEMLNEAFPGYKAPIQPSEMAEFICNFSLSSHKVLKGKVLPISLSNP
jgi:3-oxoacyl-[acyl-carrier protein] reductase